MAKIVDLVTQKASEEGLVLSRVESLGVTGYCSLSEKY